MNLATSVMPVLYWADDEYVYQDLPRSSKQLLNDRGVEKQVIELILDAREVLQHISDDPEQQGRKTVLLLDLKFKSIEDGMELLQDIRSGVFPGLESLPVIVYSANLDAGIVCRCSALGVIASISKGTGKAPDQLEDALRAAFEMPPLCELPPLDTPEPEADMPFLGNEDPSSESRDDAGAANDVQPVRMQWTATEKSTHCDVGGFSSDGTRVQVFVRGPNGGEVLVELDVNLCPADSRAVGGSFLLVERRQLSEDGERVVVSYFGRPHDDDGVDVLGSFLDQFPGSSRVAEVQH